MKIRSWQWRTRSQRDERIDDDIDLYDETSDEEDDDKGEEEAYHVVGLDRSRRKPLNATFSIFLQEFVLNMILVLLEIWLIWLIWHKKKSWIVYFVNVDVAWIEQKAYHQWSSRFSTKF